MRNTTIALIGAVSLFAMCGAVARSQGGQAAGRPAGPPVPKATTDKAMFWSAEDIQGRWQDLEARKANTSRLYNGTLDQTANVRTVQPGDPPLTHPKTADLWIIQGGTATAVTDGTMVPADASPEQQRAAAGGDIRGKVITGGTERPVKAGDILYVPPGVPHYFKDPKGFRAFLIRSDPAS